LTFYQINSTIVNMTIEYKCKIDSWKNQQQNNQATEIDSIG